jgi:hypothetical protein
MLLKQRENGFGTVGKEAVPLQLVERSAHRRKTPDVPVGIRVMRRAINTPLEISVGQCAGPAICPAAETVKEAVCPSGPLIFKTPGQRHRGVHNETSPSVFMALVDQIVDLEFAEFVPVAKFPNTVDSFGNRSLPHLLDGARPYDHLDVMVER